MIADLAWPLTLGAVACLWLLLRFIARERRAQRAAEARRALHRERLAAVEHGHAPPEEPADGSSAGRPGPTWESLMLGLGLVLLCAGMGAFLGFRWVPRTPEMLGMQELASLGLIPAMVGAGLILYALLLHRGGGGAG